MAKYEREIQKRPLAAKVRLVFEKIKDAGTTMGLVVCDDGSGGRLVAVNSRDDSVDNLVSIALRGIVDLLKDEDGVVQGEPIEPEALRDILQTVVDRINRPIGESSPSFNNTVLYNPESLSGYSVCTCFVDGDASYMNLTHQGTKKLIEIFAAAGLKDNIFSNDAGIQLDGKRPLPDSDMFIDSEDLQQLKAKNAQQLGR